MITRGQGIFPSDFTLCGACFVSPGTGVLLVRAVVSLVGPGVRHRKGWVGMTAGQCWCKNASRESSQRIGGQQERTACGGVGGKGKCALNTGVPRQRSSLGCHFRKGWSNVREQGLRWGRFVVCNRFVTSWANSYQRWCQKSCWF